MSGPRLSIGGRGADDASLLRAPRVDPWAAQKALLGLDKPAPVVVPHLTEDSAFVRHNRGTMAGNKAGSEGAANARRSLTNRPESAGGRLMPDSIRIPLSRGQFAIVDAEDAERVLAFKWSAHVAKGGFRAARRPVIDGKEVNVYLHRFILDAPDGVFVDHINGDPLDCRRANLRLATNAQNAANQRARRNNRSGFKGVYPQRGRWAAGIYANGKTVFLGTFSSPEEAARAYDDAARRAHGAFACVNFPQGGERGAR